MKGKNGISPGDAEDPVEDLAADVYEGDLHALRELRERSVEPKARRESALAAVDSDADGDESRDSLWPLIR